MKEFLYGEEGAAAVEYGMIVGLLALLAFVILKWLAYRLQWDMVRFFWQYLWW